MAPADEGFEPYHFVRRKPHDRLIVDVKAAVGDGFSKLLFEFLPLLQSPVHIRFKKFVIPASRRLRAVKSRDLRA